MLAAHGGIWSRITALAHNWIEGDLTTVGNSLYVQALFSGRFLINVELNIFECTTFFWTVLICTYILFYYIHIFVMLFKHDFARAKNQLENINMYVTSNEV